MLKKIKATVAAVVIGVAFSYSAYAAPTNYPTELVRIIDGDTMEVRIELGFGLTIQDTIRIMEYDAPETYRPSSLEEKMHGLEAKQEAIDLLSDGFLIRREHGRGSFGRVLVDITLMSGEDYVEVMEGKGLYKKENYEDNF